MLETAIRLPDGEIVKVSQGWNDFGSRGRIYLRRDGSTVFDGRPQPDGSGSLAVTSTTPEVATLYPAWQRPPFEPGNTMAVTHGAESPRRVEPLAAEMIAEATEAAPFLSEPSFGPALKAWARAEARCALLAAYLDENGLLDSKGNPRPATRLMTQMETLALKQRTRLGLDAASRAGIEASLTSSAAAQASLEAALDRGAEQLRERMAHSQTGDPT